MDYPRMALLIFSITNFVVVSFKRRRRWTDIDQNNTKSIFLGINENNF
jgi:hypothetical protein